MSWKWIAAGLFAFLCLATRTHATVYPAGEVSHDVLNVAVDARNAALGESLTAEDGGAGALGRNPAGLAGLYSPSLHLQGGAWIAGTQHDFISYAHPLIAFRRPSAVGASVLFASSGNIEERDRTGVSNGTFAARAAGFDLAAAHALSRNVRVGLELGFLKDLGGASAGGGSLGLLVRAGQKSSIGVAASNAVTSNGGRSPLSFNVGAATRLFRERVLTTADLKFPVAGSPWFRAGVEWLALDSAARLFVRGGLRLHPSPASWGSAAGPSLGFGIANGVDSPWQVGLDYALVPYGDFDAQGTTHRIGLNLAAPRPKAMQEALPPELRSRVPESAATELRKRPMAELSNDGRSITRAIVFPLWPQGVPDAHGWSVTVIHPVQGDVFHVKKAGLPPPSITWEGKDDRGAPVPESARCTYRAALLSNDGRVLAESEPLPMTGGEAGDAAGLNPEASVELSPRGMELQRARLKLPELKRLPDGAGWRVIFTDASGREIGKMEGKGAPPRTLELPLTMLSVQGKTVSLPMGASFRFAALDPKGVELFQTAPIALVPKSRQLEHAEALRPRLTVVTVPERDVTGSQIERVAIQTTVENPAFVTRWRVQIVDSRGAELSKAEDPEGKQPIPPTVNWSGKTPSGEVRNDWKDQFYKFSVTDVTGTERVTSGPLVSQATLAEAKDFGTRTVMNVQVRAVGTAPGPTQYRFTMKPALAVAFKKWKFSVLDPEDAPLFVRSGDGRPPESLEWDAKKKDGSAVPEPARLRYKLEVEDPYETAEIVESRPLLAVAGQPVSMRVQRRVRISIFGFNQSDIRPYMYVQLSKAAELIRKLSASIVEVNGFTDNVGAPDVNQRLSQERARNTALYLEQKENCDVSRAKITGFGTESPVDTNDTEDGRAHNRRVEILVTTEPGAADAAPRPLPPQAPRAAAVASPQSPSRTARLDLAAPVSVSRVSAPAAVSRTASPAP